MRLCDSPASGYFLHEILSEMRISEPWFSLEDAAPAVHDIAWCIASILCTISWIYRCRSEIGVIKHVARCLQVDICFMVRDVHELQQRLPAGLEIHI